MEMRGVRVTHLCRNLSGTRTHRVSQRSAFHMLRYFLHSAIESRDEIVLSPVNRRYSLSTC